MITSEVGAKFNIVAKLTDVQLCYRSMVSKTMLSGTDWHSDSLTSTSKEVHSATDNVKIKMKNLQQCVSQKVWFNLS